jgi:sphingolipid delta-4 desaturase
VTAANAEAEFMPVAFHVSDADQPHPARTKAILKAHPEIRGLMGHNPWTAAIMLLVVGLQIALAGVLGGMGLKFWWLALLAAWGIGAFANHTLYVIIHDATHGLIFRSRSLNHIAAIVSDLPNVVPGAIGFSICHLKHHAHQGDYDRDADISSDWEARLVGNRWYAKALWLLFYTFAQLTRPARLKSISVFNAWTFASLFAALAFDALMVALFDWNALLYLFASLMFAIGLHPLGARWIQEHYTLDPAQETFSYYGPLNRIALNVGYHNEHHDFPSIPWSRLPKVRAAAPEFYDTLKYETSWSRLLLRFVFDPRYSLHSRVTR